MIHNIVPPHLFPQKYKLLFNVLSPRVNALHKNLFQKKTTGQYLFLYGYISR